MDKTAVVLFNLGGPDSRETIRPFLINFFMDRNIIRLPLPLRWVLARLIANRRAANEAGKSYGSIGGRSPLLENTIAQQNALQEKLGAGYRVFTCMRYWHPMTDETVRAVKDYAPDRIVLLPLYPQYSTTTTRSSLQQWKKFAARHGLSAPVTGICCYWDDPGFLKVSAAHIAETYRGLEKTHAAPRLLFSAHGLPEAVIRDGDPYQYQCEAGAAKIAETLMRDHGLKKLDWTVCYQSRVGRLRWIGPSTAQEIERAARDGVPVLIYPHAFVNEHVETLAEIEIEYRHLAAQHGVPAFARVPVAGTDGVFISALAALVKTAETRPAGTVMPGSGPCPAQFRRCCLHEKSVGFNTKAA